MSHTRSQGKRMGFALFLGIFFLGLAPAHAQDWARAMFNCTSHDFGTVARGAKAEYRFVVENVYEEDAHILSVSSSCGCTTPQLTKQFLKTWEKAEVIATLDTRGDYGRKEATITVKFERPFPAEVQLHVYAYIRSDVVVQPGAAEFGAIRQGEKASRTLAITYAGREDWRIERVECSDPRISTRLVETGRDQGQIGYNLVLSLGSGAAPGYLRGPVVLITNDANARSARVPIAVEGLVESSLSVRPSPLLMGLAEVGRPVTRTLVVQGREPFRIRSVRSSDPRFQCSLPAEAKTLHSLPVTFLAKEVETLSGAISAKLRIETDLHDAASAEVNVSVQIVPAKTSP